jgi:hypothetical protein
MLRRLQASLQTSLRLLLRSAACVCQHYMAPLQCSLPMHWSPFAWLALVREASQGGHQLEGLAAAASQSGEAPQASQAAGASGVSPAPALEVHPCFLDQECDDEDWNLLQVRAALLAACTCGMVSQAELDAAQIMLPVVPRRSPSVSF